MELEFSQQVSEKTQVSSFIRIRPVLAELFYADGRTEERGDRETWQGK